MTGGFSAQSLAEPSTGAQPRPDKCKHEHSYDFWCGPQPHACRGDREMHVTVPPGDHLAGAQCLESILTTSRFHVQALQQGVEISVPGQNQKGQNQASSCFAS